MDIAQRIAQFESMVREGADPDNDMAWFSLGAAYVQAGRHADAAAAFERCITINRAMSKAYQLAGKALVDSGRRDRAVEVLTEGFKVAAAKGDRLPGKAMGDMLAALGAPVPDVAERKGAAAAEFDGFVCGRTGRPGSRLARPPFRGPVGEWIAANISRETWDSWLGQGTKVINELRLDLSREEDAETYDRYMREFLGIDEDLHRQIRGG